MNDCSTCSGTVQCVACRMDGRPPPKLRRYPGRAPLDGRTARGIRPAQEREVDPDEDHRSVLVDTDRGLGEV
jgi:hypothetical protein